MINLQKKYQCKPRGDQEVKTLVKVRSAYIFHWKLNIAINPNYFSYHFCWGYLLL